MNNMPPVHPSHLLLLLPPRQQGALVVDSSWHLPDIQVINRHTFRSLNDAKKHTHALQ